MTNPRPAPASRFSANAWWFLLGLVLFGAFGLATFFGAASVESFPGGTVALAALMIVITGGAALWAIRAGRVGLGSGLLVGYAVAAVASGGQCTFLTGGNPDYGFLGGAIVYAFGAALMLAVAVVASVVSLVMQRRGGPQ